MKTQQNKKNSDYRILLVEDNELNMEIMEEMLDMTGIETEKAYNGQEAMEMMRSHPAGYYDLIFMDIQMPVMNGYEATRQIRQMEQNTNRHIPIFAVSANALAEDIRNATEAGMDGHISKPVDPDSLENVLRQYL